jgi:hypothetical protein
VCEDSAGAHKSESFEDSGEKLRRDNVFIHAGEDSSHGACKGKETKVEAFERVKLFQF